MSFNIVKIIVSKSIPIPQNVSCSIVFSNFLKSVFGNNVLESVQLVPTLIGIDIYLLISFYSFLKLIHLNIIELLSHILLYNYLWFFYARHILFLDC